MRGLGHTFKNSSEQCVACAKRTVCEAHPRILNTPVIAPSYMIAPTPLLL